MSCITYRTSDGKVIRGSRAEACEELHDELAGWASDLATEDEGGFATYAVDVTECDTMDEAWEAAEHADAFGIRWEQVCNREAEHEYDVEGWYNFEAEWRSVGSAFPFILMEDGTVWERLQNGDGYRFTFDALDPDTFINVCEATPEQAAELPEPGCFNTAVPYWPIEFIDDNARIIHRAWFYDAEGDVHETSVFYED